jgi:hypothetical protein
MLLQKVVARSRGGGGLCCEGHFGERCKKGSWDWKFRVMSCYSV